MKVLQVNCVYKYGSTGKILYDLHTSLISRGVQSVICYGRGKRYYEEAVYKTSGELIAKGNNLLSRFTGIQYGNCLLSTNKLLSIISKEKPDVVHLHCINGFFVNIYRLLTYLKSNNIPTVITLHAEFLYTGNCGHSLDCEKWKYNPGCGQCPQLKAATASYFLDRTRYAWSKMNEAFTGFRRLVIVSVSPWLMNRAQTSAIMKNMKHECIFNGIDTDNVFCYRPKEAKKLKNDLGLTEKKVVLYVTAAFTEFKGSTFVLEMAKRLPNVCFVIVGNKNAIDNVPLNVLPIGRVENQQKLSEFYSMADLTLLTSKKETYSMVCAESLSCGTRIVGFEAGAPEMIAIPEYSSFCEYGNVDQLEELIKTNLLTSIVKEDVALKAKSEYSVWKMTNAYVKVYEELLDA